MCSKLCGTVAPLVFEYSLCFLAEKFACEPECEVNYIIIPLHLRQADSCMFSAEERLHGSLDGNLASGVSWSLRDASELVQGAQGCLR